MPQRGVPQDFRDKKEFEVRAASPRLVCSNLGANGYSSHKRWHIQKYACSKKGCRSRFSSKKHLERHLWVHVEEKAQCRYCGSPAGRPDNYRRHLKDHHRGGLSASVARGDEAAVRMLLEQKADTTQDDGKGISPLYDAASRGHRGVCELLLAHGADPNFQPGVGTGAVLKVAAVMGHEEVVRILLNSGADPELNESSASPSLVDAAERGYERIVGLLLDHGANIESRNYYGTALHSAVKHNHEGVVRLLLGRGANIESFHERDRTALGLAIIHHCEGPIRALLDHGADVKSCGVGQDGKMETALSLAVRYHHRGIVRLLSGFQYGNQTPDVEEKTDSADWGFLFRSENDLWYRS